MTVRALLAALLCSVSCTVTDGAGLTSLGRFAVCLRRLSDSCTTSDGSCRTGARTTLGVTLSRGPDGLFLWTPDVDGSAVRGRLTGRRFELVTTLSGVDLPCGCRGDVTETLRGELLVDAPDGGCEDAPSEGTGCAADTASSQLFETAPGDDWLRSAPPEPEGGWTPRGVRVWVVDASRPAAEGGCSCAACDATFEAVGSL